MLTPLQSLRRKSYQHLKISSAEYVKYVSNLKIYRDLIKSKGNEGYYQDHLMDFLKNTYFSPNNLIAVDGDIDFVIHSSAEPESSLVVLFEVKTVFNTTEMITVNNLNKKAMREILLYYLRERVTKNNLELKYLVVTNTVEFFIFDAHEFERLFYKNSKLKNDFREFEDGRASGKTTDFFYANIASKYIDEIKDKIEYVHFNINDYIKLLDKEDDKSRNKLSVLYKILSPNYLLKQSVQQDHNSLNKNFYNELLHIIGLEEIKEKNSNKKIIQRLEKNRRNYGSIIENTITKLDADDSLSKINNLPSYGTNKDEQLFNVALELSMTWVNRILFLKLLEAQLFRYNGEDKSQGFLNYKNVKDYDELYKLFFQILAKKYEERNDVSTIPYLNSSLFEFSKLEHITIKPSSLDNDLTINVSPSTVLKNKKGKELPTLEYLLRFLDAYDFGNESNCDILDDDRTLISASVLGLIFEKINGYKDGAIFTPSFVTMYMCRESIVQVIIKKFNTHYGWNCSQLNDVSNNLKVENIKEANDIIDSITICDPAVGSGHFLVSALNEIIRIKYELEVLVDSEGKRIKDYNFDIVNDELIVTDEDGAAFKYNKNNKASQRLQETLFNEKRKIIENCLFGVDINENSVNICRLRLWIELLKNTYYTKESGYIHLETLPNIDINIKCGNSLLSRFEIDVDINRVLNVSGIKVEDYRSAVLNYKTASSKDSKKRFDKTIQYIKKTISMSLSDIRLKSSSIYTNLRKKNRELEKYENNNEFDLEYDKISVESKKIIKLRSEVKKLQDKFDKLKAAKTYENSLEWRFEFPEVWDDKGNFIGFDLIIGNPPYVQLQANKGFLAKQLKDLKYETFTSMGDIYCLFYELGLKLLKPDGIESYITSNKWMRAGYGEKLRLFFTSYNPTKLLDLGAGIFDNVTVDSNILFVENTKYKNQFQASVVEKNNLSDFSFLKMEIQEGEAWTILNPVERGIKKKVENFGTPLKDWDIEIYRGVLTGYNEAFIITTEKRNEILTACKDEEERERTEKLISPILRGQDIKRYSAQWAELWLINTHNGVRDKFPCIDIRNYPAVKAHLDAHLDKLEKRADKGSTPYNLRNCAYLEEFGKEKIVFQEMVQESCFMYDSGNHYFCVDTGRIITGKNIKYLIALLNSKLFFYGMKYFYAGGGLGEKGVRMKHTFMNEFPLSQLSLEQQQPYIDLIDKILEKKNKDIEADTTDLEDKIDNMVYALYDLTQEEIELIDPDRKVIQKTDAYV